MKKLFLLLIWISTSVGSYGQKGLSFEEAKEKGILTSHLDSIYASSIDADTNKGVFRNNSEEFIAAYYKLLQDFGKYLSNHNFLWNEPTNEFHRIYFNKEGKIDYYLYSIRPNPLTTEQQKRFAELLTAFLMDYKFPLKASENFVQCGSSKYMPTEK